YWLYGRVRLRFLLRSSLLTPISSSNSHFDRINAFVVHALACFGASGTLKRGQQTFAKLHNENCCELPCDYWLGVLLYVLTRRIAQSTFIMKNLLILAVMAAALFVC